MKRRLAPERVMPMMRLPLLAASAVIVAAGVLLLAPPASAQSAGCMGNDCFATATELGTSRPQTFTVDTQGASTEPRERLECGAASRTVWVKFTAVTDGYARVRQTAASEYEFSIVAYDSEAGAITDLRRVDCAVGSPWSLATLDFFCEAGETYYFQVANTLPAGWNTNVSGAASFRLEGCGQTGTTYSAGSYVVVNSHENSATTPCGAQKVCSSNVGYDANTRVTVDRTPTTPSSYGGIITIRLDPSIRAASMSVGGGERELKLNPPPPPPPPPSCGTGCEPPEIQRYAREVEEYARRLALTYRV